MRWLERLADRRERVREKTISLTPTFKHLQRSILPVITRILRRRWRGARGGEAHSMRVHEIRQKSQKFLHKYNKLALSQLE